MDLIKMTEDIWKTYFFGGEQSNFQLLDILDPDCVIIGTGKHEFYKNVKEFTQALAIEMKERKNIQFQVKNFWCEKKEISPDVCLVYGGLYIWWESEDKRIYINMDSRFSFLYRMEGQAWKLVHIHQSLPNMEQLDGEYFPKTLFKQMEKSQEKIAILTDLAQKDSLTGLINYRTFQEMYRSMEKDKTWLFVLDLDDFKDINDSFGHMAGNDVLQKMADILTSAVRSQDIVCRMGGDEFVLLCSNLHNDNAAEELMKRLLKSVDQRGEMEEVWTGMSIGGTLVRDGEILEDAFRRADSALYAAKTDGKNRYRIV